ncbi:hypothetical protein BJ684DRAFT_16531 [Piptocephalis cylindrospora]|uniref:non-specific serine/threonine protein kinase n=1 Tax=Piptocephalis cylindrospora TaxID=1907219 RepID=A0A4P9Y340_9FUNG|nr:hypothetical protein BJ684DRAFT_16531 [Piptocephalis cylindrospora]|eukprot:RKP13032.1 hypothetical protein BJ684DRAFT_16531 [Piptocephalis cylindrospora]
MYKMGRSRKTYGRRANQTSTHQNWDEVTQAEATQDWWRRREGLDMEVMEVEVEMRPDSAIGRKSAFAPLPSHVSREERLAQRLQQSKTSEQRWPRQMRKVERKSEGVTLPNDLTESLWADAVVIVDYPRSSTTRQLPSPIHSDISDQSIEESRDPRPRRAKEAALRSPGVYASLSEEDEPRRPIADIIRKKRARVSTKNAVSLRKSPQLKKRGTLMKKKEDSSFLPYSQKSKRATITRARYPFRHLSTSTLPLTRARDSRPGSKRTDSNPVFSSRKTRSKLTIGHRSTRKPSPSMTALKLTESSLTERASQAARNPKPSTLSKIERVGPTLSSVLTGSNLSIESGATSQSRTFSRPRLAHSLPRSTLDCSQSFTTRESTPPSTFTRWEPTPSSVAAISDISSLSPGMEKMRSVEVKTSVSYPQTDIPLRRLDLRPKRGRPSGKKSNELQEAEFDIVNAMDVTLPLYQMPMDLKDPESFHELLRLCQQDIAQSFRDILPPFLMKDLSKLGEATYSEVYGLRWGRSMTGWRIPSAVKVIPFGEREIGEEGWTPLTTKAVLQELQMTLLYGDSRGIRPTSGRGRKGASRFVQLYELGIANRNLILGCGPSAKVCHGPYPKGLLGAWDAYHDRNHSHNERPGKGWLSMGRNDTFRDKGWHYLVLVLEDAGEDLETLEMNEWKQALSILTQTALAIASAEYTHEFEHRDLHWGNVMVLETNTKNVRMKTPWEGTNAKVSLPTQGYVVRIIDLTFSRTLKYGRDGAHARDKRLPRMRVEMGKEEKIFMALEDEEMYQGYGKDHPKGDYQYDVYRAQREMVGRDWQGFYPRTNVLWMHYLAHKMLTSKKGLGKESGIRKGLEGLSKEWMKDEDKYKGMVEVSQSLLQLGEVDTC